MSSIAYATPGECRSGIIDYGTPDGLKYYTTAIKGLDEKYDLKPEGLKAFLDNVRKRAVNFGFTNVLEIPTQASLAAYLAAAASAPTTSASTPSTTPAAPTTPGGTPIPTAPTPVVTTTAAATSLPALVTRNLLTTYGSIQLTECQETAKTYYGSIRDRMCQNSSMLYNFVANSITGDASNELALESHKYMIGHHADGACFLKLLISKVQVDTMSTVNTLRAAISKLDVKVADYKGDIKAFNTYVKTLTTSMASYGQAYPELLVNLFNAYQAVEDDDFHQYIMMRRNMWEDSTWTITPTALMNLVENHYKMRIENGTWKAVVKKDERIVALTSTGRGTGGGMTREDRDKKYAWKLVEPNTEAGKKEVKSFEGRQYHWCTKHRSWTLHTDAQCQGVGTFKNRRRNQGQGTQESNASINNNNPKREVKVDESLAAHTNDREPLVL